MTEETPSQMSAAECRQIYRDIFSKHRMYPDSLEQLGDFKNKAVQEVCEAGPEVFRQWLKDCPSAHIGLQKIYLEIQDRSLHHSKILRTIAFAGAAVWNCWQIDKYGKHALGGASIETDITLHDLLHIHRNFRGFYFHQPIQFSGQVDGEAYFHKAVFFQKVNFSLCILEKANFTETRFTQEVSFEKAVFRHIALFKKAIFHKRAVFCNTQFYNTTMFSEADFQNIADFTESEFKGRTFFMGTKFRKFDDSRYIAIPDHRVFITPVRFTRAQFSNTTNFNTAKFDMDVSFMDANFSQEANFRGTIFQGKARFHNCKFHNKANFGIFVDQSKNRLEKTSFAYTPEFYNSELHQDVDIIQAEFPKPDGSDANRRACRTLKLAFSKYQAVREEQFFYRLEVMEEQKQLKKELEEQKKRNRGEQGNLSQKDLWERRWRYRFLQIYGFLSDYGFSITRPFITLGVTFLFSWILYLIPGCVTGYSCSQSVWNATAISAAYTLPPLAAEWSVRDKIRSPFPYTTQEKRVLLVTAAVYVWLIIQRLFSLLLWFFIFLYWRNIARSK